jgi:hypothetical protein
MIVAAMIGLLAASAVPGFLRARKRSQVSRIPSHLRSPDFDVDQNLFDAGKKFSGPRAVSDWTNHLKRGFNVRFAGRDMPVRGPGARSVGVQSTVPSIFKEDLFDA